MGIVAPTRHLRGGYHNSPLGSRTASKPPTGYVPGGIPAGYWASETATSRFSGTARRYSFSIVSGRWKPSGMNMTLMRSSVSAVKITFS